MYAPSANGGWCGMDREFAQVLYRALMMVATYLAKRYGFGRKENET